DAVVVGELEHRGLFLVVVADEGERILLLRPVGGAQQLHAEGLGIEPDRALQVADAQHSVQESHRFPFRIGNAAPASSRRSRACGHRGYRRSTSVQKRGEWLSSTRCALSWAIT